MESLKDKNVLILGATGGIGAASARLIKASGANVFLAARNEEKLNTLATELSIPSSQVFLVDISKYNQITSK